MSRPTALPRRLALSLGLATALVGLAGCPPATEPPPAAAPDPAVDPAATPRHSAIILPPEGM
ncbi:MAG: hypothetical protein ACK5Q0_12795, partial [Lysobacteraceae bacterium]